LQISADAEMIDLSGELARKGNFGTFHGATASMISLSAFTDMPLVEKAVRLRYQQLNDLSNSLAGQVPSHPLVDCPISAEPKRRTLDLTTVD
jgi:hypothetical protein